MKYLKFIQGAEPVWLRIGLLLIGRVPCNHAGYAFVRRSPFKREIVDLKRIEVITSPRGKLAISRSHRVAISSRKREALASDPEYRLTPLEGRTMFGNVKSMFCGCFAPSRSSKKPGAPQGRRDESPRSSVSSSTDGNPLSGTRPGSSSNAGPGTRVVPRDENAFGGYLLARAAMHRKIDNTPEIKWTKDGAMADKQVDSLNRLKAANDTVEETRSLLPYGRGNVVEDNRRTHYESSRRDEAAIHLMDDNSHLGDDPNQLTAATFRFVKAARCGGSAPIATHIHGNKLGDGYHVSTVEGKKTDHTWTEVTRKAGRRQDDPIIDAWCDGPAVLREDASYGKTPAKTLHQLDTSTGPEAAKKVERISERLESDPVQQNLLKFYTGTGEFDYHSDGYKRYATEFDSQSVYQYNFRKEAGQALHGDSRLPSMKGTPRHPPQLTQEIQAVGVALSLKGGLIPPSPRGEQPAAPASSRMIRNALGQAPGIVESAQRQFPLRDP